MPSDAAGASPATTPASVRVELGARGYDILIGEGLLAEAGSRIADALPGARAAIVTDANVAAHHLEPLMASLGEADISATATVIEPGEGSKSFGRLEEVVDALLASRLERGDAVIALGGGVVGDLSGFAAGVTRRGMNLVQMPTSLLAQVDSSVGGKTGINTPRGKNLVGLFLQPQLVLADTAVLDTLPERQFRAGYAEIVKYGLLGDAPFFEWLKENWGGVFSGGDARRYAIAKSCRAKAAIVAADELEAGERALLNLGHTFGHALEAATGFSDRLIHGEAISIGMVLAAEFSARAGHCDRDTPEIVRDHFETVGLPTSLAHVEGGLPPTDTLMEHISQDKKVSRGKLTFILMKAIGEAFIASDVAPAEIASFLEERLPGR